MIKVYNYVYYASYNKNGFGLQESEIYKKCYVGKINNDKIVIWDGDKELYYDDYPLKVEIKLSEYEVVLDYYTIDEIYGYEHFIKWSFNVLANKLFLSRKVLE